ncbi:MAG: TolC family protein [Bacteroidales bacterium]|nr:TolC family protein [Bacteroidales bacterium]
MKKIIILCLLFSEIIGQPILAQVDKMSNDQRLSFSNFLHLVSHNNLEYAAEKYNVQVSEAAIELAKVFPNPSFSLDWADSREGQSRTGYGIVSEVGTTLEMGGKRKARIDLARSERDLTQALLDDYFRNLRADATIVYLEAVKQDQLYQVLLDSYQTMKQLSDADSIRLSLGSIMDIDAIQSKLEAGILLNELLQGEADKQNSFAQLNLMTGISISDTSYYPVDKLDRVSKHYMLTDLISTGLQNRSDLVAAALSKEMSTKARVLAKRQRIPDLDINVGVGNDFAIPDIGPRSKSFSAGLAIPIMFSNMYKGDLKIAEYYERQAEKQFSLVQLKIRTEITEAYQNYISAKSKVNNFEMNLLNQSEKVLKGKMYSYKRGETSLLEVLNAQRTYNEIQTSYIETQNESYNALIELERAAGIWDMIF